MNVQRPVAGRPVFGVFSRTLASAIVRSACGILAVTLAVAAAVPVDAAGRFPFDQELVLDAAPMRPAKRMPVLTVSEDGRATVDLWCRTVVARVQVADSAIRIETAPLPEALPQYMSAGQCSESRVQADSDMLLALAQVTQWQPRGDGIELKGPDQPKPMRFHRSSH